MSKLKKYILTSKINTINNKSVKRLVKKSMMDLEMFKGTLDQLGDKGRDILKSIEDFKFELEQAGRIVTNDQMLTQKLVQKRKMLDQAANQIYGIVFDIENIDITQAYQEQQMMVNNQGNPDMQTETLPSPSSNDMSNSDINPPGSLDSTNTPGNMPMDNANETSDETDNDMDSEEENTDDMDSMIDEEFGEPDKE